MCIVRAFALGPTTKYGPKIKPNLVTPIEPKPLERPNNTTAHPTRPTNPDGQTPVHQPRLPERLCERACIERGFELRARGAKAEGVVANGLLTQPICLVPTLPPLPISSLFLTHPVTPFFIPWTTNAAQPQSGTVQ